MPIHSVTRGLRLLDTPRDEWRPLSFTLVTGALNAFEPTLVRDTDGGLLFSARPAGSTTPHAQSLFVWRSSDNGATWRKVIDVPHLRQANPVTLNTAADGSPFVLCNQSLGAFVSGHHPDSVAAGTGYGGLREIVCLWPLNPRRNGLLSPLVVRFPRYELGLPPDRGGWTCDHLTAGVVRLADGRPRTLVCYRLLAEAEVNAGLPPTPHSGLYVEELTTGGEA
jgi:hypothetical protein